MDTANMENLYFCGERFWNVQIQSLTELYYHTLVNKHTWSVSSLLSICLSPSQWKTWSVMMDLYRSHTLCPKTSWRSSTNPTKHLKRVKRRTEDHLTFRVHETTKHCHRFSGYLNFHRFTLLTRHLFSNKFTKTNLLILHFLMKIFFYCVCAYVVLMNVHMKGPSMWMQVMWNFKLQSILST